MIHKSFLPISLIRFEGLKCNNERFLLSFKTHVRYRITEYMRCCLLVYKYYIYCYHRMFWRTNGPVAFIMQRSFRRKNVQFALTTRGIFSVRSKAKIASVIATRCGSFSNYKHQIWSLLFVWFWIHSPFSSANWRRGKICGMIPVLYQEINEKENQSKKFWWFDLGGSQFFPRLVRMSIDELNEGSFTNKIRQVRHNRME